MVDGKGKRFNIDQRAVVNGPAMLNQVREEQAFGCKLARYEDAAVQDLSAATAA